MATTRKAPEPDPIEVEEEAVEEFDAYPTTPGDTYRVELTMPVSQNGQTYWVKVGEEIAALPGETADDASARASDIALINLFNTANQFEDLLEARRRNKFAATNKERNI